MEIFIVVVVTISIAFAGFMVVRAVGGLRQPGWSKKSDAINGQATVTSINDTGTTVNHAPMFDFTLQVTIPGQAPYEATEKKVVSRASLGSMQPGLTVAVKVKADDHSKVWMDFSQPASMGGGAAGAAAGQPAVASTGSAAELLATGTPGWATLTTAQPMGMTAGQAGPVSIPGTEDDPVYALTVEVRLDGGAAPFNAQFAAPVPQDRIATLAPGTNLRVAVDPSAPSQMVAIDWSAA